MLACDLEVGGRERSLERLGKCLICDVGLHGGLHPLSPSRPASMVRIDRRQGIYNANTFIADNKQRTCFVLDTNVIDAVDERG